MTRFGRASRGMDLIGLALLAMMLFVLWVQHSAAPVEANAQVAPEAVRAVGAVVQGDGSTAVKPQGAERI